MICSVRESKFSDRPTRMARLPKCTRVVESGHGRGMGLDAPAPAGVVDLVRAIGAWTADAKVVPPVPVVVEPVGRERHELRRADPQVVVRARRRVAGRAAADVVETLIGSPGRSMRGQQCSGNGSYDSYQPVCYNSALISARCGSTALAAAQPPCTSYQPVCCNSALIPARCGSTALVAARPPYGRRP
jgi:hypothetical protein